VLVSKAQRIPLISGKELEAATGFQGQKCAFVCGTQAVGLRAHAEVKVAFTESIMCSA
jgi:hypothetical protein